MAEEKPIEITTELLEKARMAKSADEIAAIAREQGIDMSADDAETTYAMLHEAEGEISDDELDNVAGGGGCGESPNKPCECGEQFHRTGSQVYHGEADGQHFTQYYKCVKCGRSWSVDTILK